MRMFLFCLILCFEEKSYISFIPSKKASNIILKKFKNYVCFLLFINGFHHRQAKVYEAA